MSLFQRPSPADAAVPLLAAAASFFTLLSWAGLSDDAGSYLVPLYWVALGVAVLGIVLRAARVPTVLVPPAQLVAVGLVMHHQWSAGGLLGGWVPTRTSVELFLQVLDLSVETTSRYVAPVPADEPMFAPIMVVVGAVVVLSVDALAASFRRGPAAGLPLLAAFTVSVSLLGGVPWVTFALTAAAFVMMLAADQAARLGQWGRRVGDAGAASRTRPGPVRLGSLWPAAGRIGAVGIGAAVLAPLFVPAGNGWFDGGDGPGLGGGGQRVTLDNPFVDIRRDLIQQEDIELVTAVTDDPDPSYLRLTVLDEFDGDKWRPSERLIPVENKADGGLPLPAGLQDETPRKSYDWLLEVSDQFETTWLPTPYPASAVVAPGDWRYDIDTLDLVNADGEDAAGLTYRARGLKVVPEPRDLAAAGPGGRSLVFDNTRLPETVPDWVEELAEDVTEGSSSTFDRAMRLQRWFRSEGGFTYSTEPDPGNGIDDLERFLGTGPDSRVGYCEQFSAAMALMARSLNIPARVTVGFLKPERVDGRWHYSSKDLHAWPEIYFEGTGWVRFEPTPSERSGGAPDYTLGGLPSPEETTAPSVGATDVQPTAVVPTPAESTDPVTESDEGWLSGSLRWLGGGLLVGLLAAAPRAWRAVVRRRRYASNDADAAVEGGWAEVRATALDLGRRWDDGETLRQRARAIVPLLGSDDAGRAAAPRLDQLVQLLERSRYSRSGLDDDLADKIRSLSRTVCDALWKTARPAAQRRATWLPASLWRGRPQRRGKAAVLSSARRRGASRADGRDVEGGSMDGSVQREEVSL